mmetsp:Transcript_29799/g.60887  ORF Transcript_29799/g.60887 Transcript_29799/m.60887 type:complete len:359 (-) Transcript_29799:1304-2380(-)
MQLRKVWPPPSHHLSLFLDTEALALALMSDWNRAEPMSSAARASISSLAACASLCASSSTTDQSSSELSFFASSSVLALSTLSSDSKMKEPSGSGTNSSGFSSSGDSMSLPRRSETSSGSLPIDTASSVGIFSDDSSKPELLGSATISGSLFTDAASMVMWATEASTDGIEMDKAETLSATKLGVSASAASFLVEASSAGALFELGISNSVKMSFMASAVWSNAAPIALAIGSSASSANDDFEGAGEEVSFSSSCISSSKSSEWTDSTSAADISCTSSLRLFSSCSSLTSATRAEVCSTEPLRLTSGSSFSTFSSTTTLSGSVLRTSLSRGASSKVLILVGIPSSVRDKEISFSGFSF